VVTVSSALAQQPLTAAASVGAGTFLTFKRVTFPLMPGTLSGAIFAFARSLDDVVVALFVAGPSQRTLRMQMYMGTGDLLNLVIAAVATAMFDDAFLMMIVVAIIRRRDTLSAAQQTAD
jgi:putative spermidine/putrescine transport system permease protein